MIINHNIPAQTTNRFLNANNNSLSNSLEKLSSGLRINKAGDDAAGLAISEKMRAQIRGLDMATKNAQDGVSLIQTAEGAMQTIEDMLQRMRELAVQSSSDTNTSTDRGQIQKEVAALSEEITRIASTTEFNTMSLLTGNFKGKLFHVGANAGQTIGVSINSMTATTLGVNTTATGVGGAISVSTQTAANAAITTIQNALNTVSSARTDLGAIQNRLEYTIQNLESASENTSSAESRIRDVNMAKEMSTYTKFNILSQSATAMLAQANQSPQNVLQLLR